MKYMTFSSASMLASTANMLECLGYDTDDRTIALGMKAPWLFIKEGDRYFAGDSLFQPRWINLYLEPLGFRLTQRMLSVDDAPAYLRTCKTAMLKLRIKPNIERMAVLTGYEDGRFSFVCVKPESSPEPASLSLTSAMLKRRLSSQVPVFTMEQCPPKAVDFIALYLASLRNLDTYQDEVMEALQLTVTRAELAVLRDRLFHALMQDLLTMTAFKNETVLNNELFELNNDFRHIFIEGSPESVLLQARIPCSSVRKCVAWLKEDIIDQLYDSGLSDEEVESLLQSLR